MEFSLFAPGNSFNLRMNSEGFLSPSISSDKRWAIIFGPTPQFCLKFPFLILEKGSWMAGLE